jgi:hypothetical protein
MAKSGVISIASECHPFRQFVIRFKIRWHSSESDSRPFAASRLAAAMNSLEVA